MSIASSSIRLRRGSAGRTKLGGQGLAAFRPAEPRLWEIDGLTINMSLLPE